jgi:hypothetical protein
MLGQFMSLMLCVMAACNHYLSTQYQVGLPTGEQQQTCLSKVIQPFIAFLL